MEMYPFSNRYSKEEQKERNERNKKEKKEKKGKMQQNEKKTYVMLNEQIAGKKFLVNIYKQEISPPLKKNDTLILCLSLHRCYCVIEWIAKSIKVQWKDSFEKEVL